MALNDHQLDPAEVRRLLDVLKNRLTEEGIDAHVHVIGGSAMALLFPDDGETRFTTDIDAAVRPYPAVRRVVEQMAEEDSVILMDTREDYLVMARQALEAEEKRSKKGPAQGAR